MLYLGDKKATLFKGDRRPVSLYLGDKKVTGYEYAEQTGEILSFERTYNDSAYIKIFGKTVEIGEGEKSPDNPYELKSVGDDGGFDLVSSGNSGQLQTINFPYTLRSLPDGTADYIEIDNAAKTAKLYINVGEKVFNGTETFSSDYQGTEYFRVYNVLSTMTNATLSSAICSHFPYGGYYQITNENFSTTPFSSPVVAFIVKRGTVGATTGNTTAELITLFKSWLADQYNNGAPVTVIYKLATPTVTDLDYNEIKTYYPYTNIYTISTVQPTLEAKIRVWTA